MHKKATLGLVTLISTIPFIALAQRDIACSITATPTRAAPGEQVTLRWNSQNARSATLVSFGPVPLSGSRIVQATQTTDYKIMVSGYENNHVGCIARITVTAKQPSCNMSLVPFAVASNNFATLSWSTDYADSVYISGIGNVQPKGNQMVRAVGNTTYYLTARGAGGLCEKSAELAVREQYQSFGYFPQTVQNITYPLFGYSNSTSNQQQAYRPATYNYQPYSNSYTTSEVVDSWDEYRSDPWYEYDDDDYSSWNSYRSPYSTYETETWTEQNPTPWSGTSIEYGTSIETSNGTIIEE